MSDVRVRWLLALMAVSVLLNVFVAACGRPHDKAGAAERGAVYAWLTAIILFLGLIP